MKRTDVYVREGQPAVNVKVYGYDWPRGVDWPTEHGDGYTPEWVEAHLTEDEVQGWWDAACEGGWEMLESDAQEIFGQHVKVYSDGRSGGWAVVHGLPDVDTWDAVMVSKWAKFARWARSTADAIPEDTASLIGINVYEPALEAHERALAALDVPEWPTALAAARQIQREKVKL